MGNSVNRQSILASLPGDLIERAEKGDFTAIAQLFRSSSKRFEGLNKGHQANAGAMGPVEIAPQTGKDPSGNPDAALQLVSGGRASGGAAIHDNEFVTLGQLRAATTCQNLVNILNNCSGYLTADDLPGGGGTQPPGATGGNNTTKSGGGKDGKDGSGACSQTQGTFTAPINLNATPFTAIYAVQVGEEYTYAAGVSAGPVPLFAVYRYGLEAEFDLLGSCNQTDPLTQMVLQGHYCWGVAVGGTANLTCINVRQPANPTQVVVLPLAAVCNGLHVQGKYAYVATAAGIVVVDISVPPSPQVVATIDGAAAYSCCFALGDWLYAGRTNDNTFQTHRIGDPTAPVANIGAVALQAAPVAMSVNDSVAYIIDNAGSLYQIDVDVPSAPAIVPGATLATGENFGDVLAFSSYVALSGSTKIVSGGSSGGGPTLGLTPVGHIDPIGTAPLALDLGDGGVALYLDGIGSNNGSATGYTLTAIDISTPSEPVVMSIVTVNTSTVGFLTVPSGFLGYCIIGDSYYVLDAGGGQGITGPSGSPPATQPMVYVFDVSDPNSLSLASTIPGSSFSTNAIVSGGIGMTVVGSLAPGASGPVYGGLGTLTSEMSLHPSNAALMATSPVPANAIMVSPDEFSTMNLMSSTDTAIFSWFQDSGGPDNVPGIMILNPASLALTAQYNTADTPNAVIAVDFGGDSYGFIQGSAHTQTVINAAAAVVDTFDDYGQIRLAGSTPSLFIGGMIREGVTTVGGTASVIATGTADINIWDASDITALNQTDGPLFATTYPDGKYSNIQAFDVSADGSLIYTIDQGPGDADVPQFEFSIWSLTSSGGSGSAPNYPASGTGSLTIVDYSALPPVVSFKQPGPFSQVDVQGRRLFAGTENVPAGSSAAQLDSWRWGGFTCEAGQFDTLWCEGRAVVETLNARHVYIKGDSVANTITAQAGFSAWVSPAAPTAAQVAPGTFLVWYDVSSSTASLVLNINGSLIVLAL
jgi:hypothetical protein